MLLKGKVSTIYGGGGTIGGAIARVFAREGAHVALAGRTRAKLEAVARDITAAGGSADVTQLDVLDPAAVVAHADAVAARSGGIDVAVNAVGLMNVHGIPFTELSIADYETPIHGYSRLQFSVAKAVAPHMVRKGGGVILSVSTPGAVRPFPGIMGFGIACAAIETFARLLACELGPSGVRVICLRPDAIPEAAARGSHSREVFGKVAEKMGTTVEGMLAEAAKVTLLGRLPTLAEVAEVAAFLASDRASAMTAAVANLSCGSVAD